MEKSPKLVVWLGVPACLEQRLFSNYYISTAVPRTFPYLSENGGIHAESD